MTDASSWRRCSACKKPIALGAVYWTCNVSTCNRKRTGLVFCTLTCWEVHLPGANHRESWAVEQWAPSTPDASPASAGSSSASSGRRRLVQDAAASPRTGPSPEVLIVASRLKDYVRSKSGFNTSEGVLAPLSDVVRRVCDDAIRHATREGRRTVLDRDVPKS